MWGNKQKIKSIIPIAAAAVTIFIAASPSLAEQTASLPGGASSLQETYQDWTVDCQLTRGVKQCAMSQTQNQKNGRRVLAIELQSNKQQNAEGVLILPFGLKLDAGVILSVDDKPALPALRFSTCLPGGCLVPLTFDARTLAVLRSGQAVKIRTQRIDGPAMTFSVSLKGFATGFDRLAVLGK
ncbi:MAG: invasion associated locus B family protein [Rhizobiales bacterium]|nr:invasion associated locus B family protein [Hyphomicrobiales bacterium]OJY04973.1 MAG: hypothetical protein BGP07_09835 [Rhizobiales bacterium 63-22]